MSQQNQVVMTEIEHVNKFLKELQPENPNTISLMQNKINNLYPLYLQALDTSKGLKQIVNQVKEKPEFQSSDETIMEFQNLEISIDLSLQMLSKAKLNINVIENSLEKIKDSHSSSVTTTKKNKFKRLKF